MGILVIMFLLPNPSDGHKERSSAKRKELFRTIQVEKNTEKAKSEGKTIIEQTKQLILDMSVRWSSTYGMLHRAVTLREVRCNTIYLSGGH